jgi:hypothetical protein
MTFFNSDFSHVFNIPCQSMKTLALLYADQSRKDNFSSFFLPRAVFHGVSRGFIRVLLGPAIPYHSTAAWKLAAHRAILVF